MGDPWEVGTQNQAAPWPQSQPAGPQAEASQSTVIPDSPYGHQPAGWGLRLGALLLDSLVLLLPVGIIYGGIMAIHLAPILSAVLQALVTGAAWAVYSKLLMLGSAEHPGQTLGMRVLEIKIVKNDQLPLDGQTVLRRQGLGLGLLGIGGTFILASLLSIIGVLYLIGWFVICPIMDKANRCPHDLLAKTRPIKA